MVFLKILSRRETDRKKGRSRVWFLPMVAEMGWGYWGVELICGLESGKILCFALAA